jgi:hypothetical protein
MYTAGKVESIEGGVGTSVDGTGFVVPHMSWASLLKCKPVISLSKATEIRDRAMASWGNWEVEYKEAVARAAGVDSTELRINDSGESAHLFTWDHCMKEPEKFYLGNYPGVEYPSLVHFKYGVPWFDTGSAIVICTLPDRSTQAWSWIGPLSEGMIRRCIPSSELRETANLYREITRASSSFLAGKIKELIVDFAPRKTIESGDLEVSTFGVRDGTVNIQQFTPASS